MYRIFLHRVAERVLDRMDRQTRARMNRALEALRVNPYAVVDAQPLQGRLDGLHRVRVGGWRVVYEIIERDDVNIVHVLDIRSRGDVYR